MKPCEKKHAPPAPFDVNIKLASIVSVEFKIAILEATELTAAGDKPLGNHVTESLDSHFLASNMTLNKRLSLFQFHLPIQKICCNIFCCFRWNIRQ